MQRNHWPYVAMFAFAVTVAIAILVAAGLGERTVHEYTALPKATVTARQ